jgi:hypothetical protein
MICKIKFDYSCRILLEMLEFNNAILYNSTKMEVNPTGIYIKQIFKGI